MKVLALEPYYGGSHRAFLDGWSSRSRHEWTVLTLPAYKWKWRMRHAAITFAQQVVALADGGASWDALFCSDMLNLAEFLGLLPERIRAGFGRRTTLYFHENQLTYPVRQASERDYQFAFTNISSALAAGGVWFNSAFHRDSFLGAIEAFLARMPDHQPADVPEQVRCKSEVHPPGIDGFGRRGPRPPGPLRICWAARWEHDKNPEDFFEALGRLLDRGVDFRVSVIGERFRDCPEVFDRVRPKLVDRIDRWGYQSSRADYRQALTEADVIVSTARHEFFGIGIVEAIAAGAHPLLPRRLSYPEMLGETTETEPFFYDGSVDELTAKLRGLAEGLSDDGTDRTGLLRAVQEEGGVRARLEARFGWSQVVPVMDDALERQC